MEGLDAVRRYKDEIAQLKSDIAELQRQKDRNEWLSVGAVSFQQLSSSTDKETENKQNSEIFGLKNQLSLLKAATGVDVTDVTVEEVDEDGSVSYLMKGTSCGIVFEVRFRETNDGIRADRRFHLGHVEIDSMEVINTGLQDCMDLCEDQSSLGLFFSIFVPYARCLADRRKAFIDIRQKHPESIDWSDGVGGSSVKIFPPNKGATFEIRWDVEVTNVFHVKSVLRLSVSAINNDEHVFRSATEMFAKMVDAMGPVRALESFVTTVCAGSDIKQE